jgi:Protein of unknown function (DUF732)
MASSSSTISVMGDETMPGLDVPTAIHAPIPGPESPLAYSETVELPEARRSHIPVALFVAAAVALTAAGTSWFLLRPAVVHVAPSIRPSSDNSVKPLQPDVIPTSSPDTVIADAPPIQTEQPPIASPRVPLDPDTIYVASLIASGVGVSNRDGVILLGHQICFRFSQGIRYDTLLADALREKPSLTPHDVTTVITAAVHVYCPQYSPQIGG